MPTEEEAKSIGFTLADYEDDYVECWPDNWPAFLLYESIQTQWRAGSFGGRIGLDYNVLFHRLDRMKLSHDEYEQLFEDVRYIEAGALSVFNKPKDQ
jgi:hypothetical protein